MNLKEVLFVIAAFQLLTFNDPVYPKISHDRRANRSRQIGLCNGGFRFQPLASRIKFGSHLNAAQLKLGFIILIVLQLPFHSPNALKPRLKRPRHVCRQLVGGQ
ncbi:MAG TPA: hypothetical protein VLQ90_03150, partial [Pyrinomonadaceae bacterium]|nr:hypothetical protein [Pyrinomonadaceae bacterium]